MFRKGEKPVKVPDFLWKPGTGLLHFFWQFQRGMTLGVRGLIVDGAGRIYLVKHGYIGGWHMPGGGVEHGESLHEALARELLEEGNIKLLARPRLHGVFLNLRASRRDHVAVFVVDDFQQESLPQPGHEIAACGFFALDALPNDTTAGTRTRIAEVFSGAPVSEYW